MTPISKGLVIDEPWISLILSGHKTWEMRSTRATLRGWFGLIRKGSGLVVGAARLVGCGSVLTTDQMLLNFEKHRIPEQMIRSGQVAKWNTPWMMDGVRKLPKPVRYQHKQGAVTWVTIDPNVSREINAQLADTI